MTYNDVEETRTYRLITLDVIGNDKSGYEVNDEYTSAYTVELPPCAGPRAVIGALKTIEIVGKTVNYSCFSILHEWDEPDDTVFPTTIDIRQTKNWKPLWLLRLEN